MSSREVSAGRPWPGGSPGSAGATLRTPARLRSRGPIPGGSPRSRRDRWSPRVASRTRSPTIAPRWVARRPTSRSWACGARGARLRAETSPSGSGTTRLPAESPLPPAGVRHTASWSATSRHAMMVFTTSSQACVGCGGAASPEVDVFSYPTFGKVRIAMTRLDAFLRMASRRMTRRQAGVAGAALLALLTGADPTAARKRHRTARCDRAQPRQGAHRLQPCGGIAGLPCPKGFVCVDDPRDDCDPEAGGADCIGICMKKATDPCATIRCRQGTTCCPQCGGICIPNGIRCSTVLCTREACNQVVCGPGEYCCNESCSICAPLGGACTDQFCGPPGQGVPCGPTICPVGQVCCNESCGICTLPGGVCTAVVCDPEPEGMCGGIAGIPCPDGFVCVDDPRDDCDPKTGGADCSGSVSPSARTPAPPSSALKGPPVVPTAGVCASRRRSRVRRICASASRATRRFAVQAHNAAMRAAASARRLTACTS